MRRCPPWQCDLQFRHCALQFLLLVVGEVLGDIIWGSELVKAARTKGDERRITLKLLVTKTTELTLNKTQAEQKLCTTHKRRCKVGTRNCTHHTSDAAKLEHHRSNSALEKRNLFICSWQAERVRKTYLLFKSKFRCNV